jgi:hypothetical protein
MKEIYEKAGLFYLGKDVDRLTFESTKVLTLLKNKNFTTHATIIGMTGSGKTGLGVGIIEEAAIDNIPAIVIDPKGDMGDLCLTDPDFSAEAFTPWVADEAKAKGEEPATYAAKISTMWKEGIENWDQNSERVARFAAVPKTIYTPGSSAGVPINLMGSLDVPPARIMEDSDNFGSYLKSTVTGLLALLGIAADPLDSKEYILLAQIIARSWQQNRALGLADLVTAIIQPSFETIGVLPVESFYPQNERFKFATRFNAVIASPNFANWLTGESLDIDRLLYDGNGQAKISIFSIAHLNDDERMFFVTLLLNKYIAWMRLQSGSNRLRTLLYMDEIYGFFPPVKNPPSKEPMITLLKQARAYGVGIVLSTQNPVDLDYKGLSNIGTWCIGRLQTTQDIERIIDGLGGKVDASFDKKEIASLLANLRKRTFFLKSAHLADIRLFGTRWVMSYLKGPLKNEEIATLMADKKAARSASHPAPSVISPDEEGYGRLVTLDGSVVQYFEPDPSERYRYIPYLAADISVGFHNAAKGIDLERTFVGQLDLEGADHLDWDDLEREIDPFDSLPTKAPADARFRPLLDTVASDKGLRKASRALHNHLYANERLELYRCRSPRMESAPDESRDAFAVRLQDTLEEAKEASLDKLKERYGKKEERLQSQLARAQERVEKEQADSNSTLIDVGISVLGALFGRRSATSIGRAVNKGTRAYKEHGQLSRAQERAAEVEGKIQDLEIELEEKIDELAEQYALENHPIESFTIKPKKSDIAIEQMSIVWRIL